ncbi:MAG: hypothetical protein ABSD74_09710 [Rhizomicrobium sp.]|jgi:hypothetical protein
MNRSSRTAALAAICVLVSQIAPALAADVHEYANIHTIAVISALGNDVDMQTYGLSSILDSDYTLHTDWNLDAQAVDEISRILAKQFTVKTLEQFRVRGNRLGIPGGSRV